jgi:hypothetical protein
MPDTLQSSDAAVELYLDLLKRCLLNLIDQDPAIRQPWDESSDREYVPFDRDKRVAGTDLPSEAHATRCRPRRSSEAVYRQNHS